MTIEIKPGPELDAAVAEAIGAESIAIEHGVCRCSVGRKLSNKLCFNRIFEPSIDTEVAFEAAQLIELFESRSAKRLLQRNDGQWVVIEYQSGVSVYDMDRVGIGETPALAICAAILKLSENR